MTENSGKPIFYWLKIVVLILLTGVIKTASASTETSLTQAIMADGAISAKEQARYLEYIGIQAVIDGNKRIKVVPTSQKIAWTNTLFKLEELGLNTATPFIYGQAQQQLAHIAKKLTQLNAQSEAQRLLLLSPTQQEVDVLNALISELPEQVKPLPIANALTWVIALNKYQDQNISELSEAEKVILISNVYAAVSVLEPQKVEETVSLVLPAGLDVNGQKLVDHYIAACVTKAAFNVVIS